MSFPCVIAKVHVVVENKTWLQFFLTLSISSDTIPTLIHIASIRTNETKPISISLETLRMTLSENKGKWAQH